MFSSSSKQPIVFNSSMKQQMRHNAAKLNDAKSYDYLREEVASRLVDRLDDVKREFPLALDLGSGSCFLHREICRDDSLGDNGGGVGGVKKIVALDSCGEVLRRDEGEDGDVEGKERCDIFRLEGDEGGKLPFPDNSFDLVVSSMSHHNVNDLPRTMREVKRILKPDRPFLFAMVGGGTLTELRSAMILAETERSGGVSSHVGPFVDASDIGRLLTSSQFALPTVDVDDVVIGYPDALILMEHLGKSGEGNAAIARNPGGVSRDMLLASASIYAQMYGEVDSEWAEDDGGSQGNTLASQLDGGIPATFQIVYGIGWTPHESQQQPDERGSAGGKKIGDMSVVEKTLTEKKVSGK